MPAAEWQSMLSKVGVDLVRRIFVKMSYMFGIRFSKNPRERLQTVSESGSRASQYFKVSIRNWSTVDR